MSICSFGLATVPEYNEFDKALNANNSDPLEDPFMKDELKLLVDDLTTMKFTRVNSFLLFVDFICLAFFVFDMLLQIVSTSSIRNLLTSPGCIVDMMSLLPDLCTLASVVSIMIDPGMMEMGVLYALRSLGPVKLMRLFRVLRLIKRVTGVMIIFYTLWASIKEMISLVTILLVTTLVFASFVYFAENGRNKAFQSVFHGCWWSIITLTTVGYGDTVPVSPVGQLIGSMCAVWGVLLLGICIPTMVTNFLTYHFLVRYIDEREIMYLYRKLANYEKLPNIPFPDFL